MATKKRRNKKSNKKKGVDITSIILIVSILAITLWFISKYFINEIRDNKDVVAKDVSHTEALLPLNNEGKDVKTKVEKNNYAISLNGCWMSTTEGAVLSVSNNTYRLDFMGVDSDEPIIGKFSLKDNIITFINKDMPCADEKGEYEIIVSNNDVRFRCINDNCTKRKATLTTEWEWLEE